MTAQDWTVIIGAIMTPLTVIFVAWINARKIDKVREVGEDTNQLVTMVNHAVNGKDPRESTLSEDVITIRDKQEIDVPTVASSDGLVPLVKQISDRLTALENKLENKLL